MPLAVVEPLGLFAQLACLWEATAQKPGNVHRFRDFEDVHYLDFVASAAAIAPVFDGLAQPGQRPRGRGCVGRTVLAAIQQTRGVTQTNTNLGMVLLLVPLALADRAPGLRAGVERLLEQLGVDDAQSVYQAIRLAWPAGLGEVDEEDVRQEPVRNLREVMALAADRDLIARQYANGYGEVFNNGVPALQDGLAQTCALEGAIISCHLHLLAKHPDSLIARKCGSDLAEDASRGARDVLHAGWPDTAAGRLACVDFDAWLRGDGHRRNPGTTADLVAASLFVALRESIITLPPQYPWSFGGEAYGAQGDPRSPANKTF
jgi:triphosphoribosyl-dephospho-CoA synthase